MTMMQFSIGALRNPSMRYAKPIQMPHVAPSRLRLTSISAMVGNRRVFTWLNKPTVSLPHALIHLHCIFLHTEPINLDHLHISRTRGLRRTPIQSVHKNILHLISYIHNKVWRARNLRILHTKDLRLRIIDFSDFTILVTAPDASAKVANVNPVVSALRSSPSTVNKNGRNDVRSRCKVGEGRIDQFLLLRNLLVQAVER